jgi:hypothetical protein
VEKIGTDEVVKVPTPAIKDDGRVRMGMMSSAFPRVRARPANVADSGQIRMGMMSPSFPPVRAR